MRGKLASLAAATGLLLAGGSPAAEQIISDKVVVFPASKEAIAKFGYKDGEYWVAGTDVVDEFSIEDASKFYTALFGLAHDRFVKRLSYDTIANYALDSLSGFDGKLDITRAESRILVYDKNLKLAGNFRAPTDDGAAPWANLVVNIILTLRENVPEIRKAHPEQIYYTTATYLLKSIDAGAEYIDPRTAEQRRTNHHSTGLGFSYRKIPGGLQVLSIAKNSPLYFTPIREGDAITHINTAPAAKLSDEMVEDIIFGNEFGLAHLNFVSYMTRQPGETFVRRNRLTTPAVALDNSEPEIPTIIIQNFREGASRELKAALDSINARKVRGIAIDLRGAQGGNLMEAMESANLLIDGGEILKTRGRTEGSNQLFAAKGGDAAGGLPIAVIADNTTKGAAEAFAASLSWARRGVLVGSPTYGRGTAPETFDLPGGRGASFAVKSIFSPSDIPLDGIGAVPPVCVSSITGDDDMAEFARNVENGKFSDNRPKYKEATPENIEAARKACPAAYPTIEAQARALKIARTIVASRGIYEILSKM